MREFNTKFQTLNGIRAPGANLYKTSIRTMSEEGKKQEATPQINLNDPQSPYFLCASDNTGNIICPVTFTGDNYGNWSRLVLNGLRSKNKLMFVDRTLIKPDISTLEGHAWERCNSMVIV